MIAIILGTRPEIIKLSPIIRECDFLGLDYFILHTGQHYSYQMDSVFFNDLRLTDAKYNLKIGSGRHGEQTAKMICGIEKILLKENPDLVLVQGDTNSVLAGALVASKLHIKIAHIEAGLRSYDRCMPEEINRILTDHCSDYLFVPTLTSKQILLNEGISNDKIHVSGNTIVDAVYQNLKISTENVNPLNLHEIHPNNYFLVTIHRQENVDSKDRFGAIIKGLELVANELDLPIIYPIHPRGRKMLNHYGLELKNIKMIEPLDYLSFLQLESNARLILTDSGGVQEESCVLKIPCVTLRENTERPETLEIGSNILAGTNPRKILESTKFMLGKDRNWNNPFGDGKSGKRILETLNNEIRNK